jgi:hypothetical protein
VIDENWSILDFVTDNETNWDTVNAQTLFLAVDLDYSQLAQDPVGYGQAVVKKYARRLNDRALLDVAVRRLEDFVSVGITERMRDSMLMLSYQMDWNPDIVPPRLNVTPTTTTDQQISHETREAIKNITQLDQELYQWAVQRFDEHFAGMVSSLLTSRYESKLGRVNPPRQLLAPISSEARRLFRIRTIDAPPEVHPSMVFHVVTEITNKSNCVIASLPPYPIHISYRWLDQSTGSVLIYDGERTKMGSALAPNEKRDFAVSVRAPDRSGRYVLRITIVQENVAWFDDGESKICSEVEVVVA